MELKFRALQAEETEVRVAQAKDKGVSLLIYMDARAAALLLDEAVGPMNWKCCYRDINGKMYCGVEIWDEDKKEWVAKENVGTESNTEAEKGQASDALKRAVATWGVRELYTAPFIWVDASRCAKLKKNTYNGKDTFKCSDDFRVSAMEVVIEGYSRRITSLEITNDSTGQVCFKWNAKTGTAKLLTTGKKQETVSKKETTTNESVAVSFKATQEQIEIIASVYKGDNLEKLYAANDITDLSELSFEKAKEIVDKLSEMAAKKNAS